MWDTSEIVLQSGAKRDRKFISGRQMHFIHIPRVF